MGNQHAGEALPGDRPPSLTPEAVMGLFIYARQEWRPLLRTRDPERRQVWVLSGLRVFAYAKGFDLYQDEIRAVRRALKEG